jgi:phosphate transport system substrate-binding protein
VWYRQKQPTKTLVLLVALSTVTPISALTLLQPAVAQNETTSFPVPTDVDSDTVVRINGSSSMSGINEALAARFQEQFAGTDVDIAYNGSEQAIQSVLNGDIDLASIGRSLTEQEQSQGLVEVPIARKKIAIIVGQNNAFTGSITTEQFAQIFRGEISDWSELGGTPGPIRFIDRPESSDTRQAFQNYPVFQTAPFNTGATAEQVSEDSVDAVIQELGTDGIGYAIVDQVIDQPNVTILPMHNVLPTDPRYPFSQPVAYVYRAPEPSEPARVFLGFIGTPESQQIAEAASLGAIPTPIAQATPAPEVTTAPLAPPEATETIAPAADPETPATTTAETGGRFPWWLLLIPILGGLLWWLLRNRGGAVPAVVPAALPTEPEASRLILTPRTCREAYAYWEVSDRDVERLRQEGGQDLKLRLYDVTDIDMENQPPHTTQEFSCPVGEHDLHVPIATDDRDYRAELGYVTEDNRWLRLARSPHVRVPACAPVPANGAVSVAAAAAAAAAAAGLATRTVGPKETTAIAPSADLVVDDSRMILVPRSPQDVYAYWELSDAHKTAIRDQNGYPLKLRLYTTTDQASDGQSLSLVKEYECPTGDVDLHIPLTPSDRDYAAELGYTASDGIWVKVAQSQVVQMAALTDAPSPLHSPNGSTGATLAAGAGAAASIGAVSTFMGDRPPEAPSASGETVSTTQTGECQIILVPRSASDAYVYWEVTENYKLPLRQQGGQNLMLRIHDATNLDIDTEAPHRTEEYPVSEWVQDQHVYSNQRVG